jgi:tellurite resistance protein TehA-like permease
VRKTKQRNLYRIIIGILMLLSGIAYMILTTGEVIIGTMLLAAGFAFLITGISRHRKYGDDSESDERSKKIGAYGLSYAWLTGIIFMSGLFWLDYLNVLRLGTQNALSASVLALIFSALIYQTYLFRKGDVE